MGGLSVNAQIIQNSIIGCQSHRTSVVWFTPAQYFPPIIQRQTHLRKETNKIIDMQWVRTLFTPLKKSASGSSIHPYALHPPEPLAHFALSTGAISDPPKVLHHYAKDAALELPDLVEMACEIMPEAQQKEIRQCLRRRIDKCVEWIPFKSSFRYTIHRSLAE